MRLIQDNQFGHFWSTDGSECLWCKQVRSAEEIAVWRAAGEPFEQCLQERR